MNKDIYPFEEEDWEELELNINHIYDVIYGCIMSYYIKEYMNYHLIKKVDDDEILLKEKINDEESNLVCTFKINDTKVDIICGNEKRFVNLTDDINKDKFKVFLGFRLTFDKYLKEKNEISDPINE